MSKVMGDFGKQGRPTQIVYDDQMGFSFNDIKDAFQRIVHTVTRTVAVNTARLSSAVNPLNQFQKIPVLKDLYKAVDKLTGGTITSINSAINLPSKALKGEKITKADLINAAVVGAKVGAIVASGGAASAYLATGAGALKQGPLGASPMGKNLLTVAEIGGAAMAISSAASTQMAAQGASEATRMTATEAVAEAVKQKGISIARTEAEKQFEKTTGIPVTVASKIYNVSTGKESIATVPKDIAKKVAEDQLKKAGLGDTVTQAILSNNAAALGVAIADVPNLAISAAQRKLDAEKVRLEKEMTLENLKKKVEDQVQKSYDELTDIDKLHDKILSETNELVKKELEKQLAKLLEDNAKTQQAAAELGKEYELEAARASLMVAAAEEGRLAKSYTPQILVGSAVLASAIGYYYYKNR